MKNTKIKDIFVILILFPLLTMAITVKAYQTAPSMLTDNSNSNKTSKSSSTNTGVESNSNMSQAKNANTTNDKRVIRQTTAELIEDDSCVDCSAVKALQASGFPVFALFAIGGGALTPLLINSFSNNAPTGPTGAVSSIQP